MPAFSEKIGSVEVGIFRLNKTNNQTVIMADMFQNVNLQTGGVCGISQYNLPRMDNCTEKTKQNKTKQNNIQSTDLNYGIV